MSGRVCKVKSLNKVRYVCSGDAWGSKGAVKLPFFWEAGDADGWVYPLVKRPATTALTIYTALFTRVSPQYINMSHRTPLKHSVEVGLNK